MPARRFSHSDKMKGSTPFGDRLKQERIRRGLSLQELADGAGIWVSQITGFENRGILPSVRSLIGIARTLECTIDWLCEPIEDDE
jgi:transcriptional regulator with XRE-family HTH domain